MASGLEGPGPTKRPGAQRQTVTVTVPIAGNSVRRPNRLEGKPGNEKDAGSDPIALLLVRWDSDVWRQLGGANNPYFPAPPAPGSPGRAASMHKYWNLKCSGGGSRAC